jgi:hypothetical protein
VTHRPTSVQPATIATRIGRRASNPAGCGGG